MLIILVCVAYMAFGALLVWYSWWPNLFGPLTLPWLLALSPFMPIRLAILVLVFIPDWLDEAENRVYSHLRDRGERLRR